MAERLIDAELLKHTTERLIKEEEQNGFYPKSWDEEVIAFKYLIDSLPTIEAKPVVYAHWESTIYTVEKAPGEIRKIVGYRCGNCGRIIEEFENYCPSCGAEMYEKRECLSSV